MNALVWVQGGYSGILVRYIFAAATLHAYHRPVASPSSVSAQDGYHVVDYAVAVTAYEYMTTPYDGEMQLQQASP